MNPEAPVEPALTDTIIDGSGAFIRERILLPWTGQAIEINRPADLDLLLDQSEHDPEQHLPYWAEVWPSGVALADAIGHQPAMVRGRRVLELGCGLGVTACAALLAGARLTVADYSPKALAFCGANTRRNAGRDPAFIQMNWREVSPAFLTMAANAFDVVIAADVCYEGRDVVPLLYLIEQVVRPGGLLWLAEPRRPVARSFLALAHDHGWHGPAEHHRGPWPDPKDAGVVVRLHRLRRRSR